MRKAVAWAGIIRWMRARDAVVSGCDQASRGASRRKSTRAKKPRGADRRPGVLKLREIIMVFQYSRLLVPGVLDQCRVRCEGVGRDREYPMIGIRIRFETPGSFKFTESDHIIPVPPFLGEFPAAFVVNGIEGNIAPGGGSGTS